MTGAFSAETTSASRSRSTSRGRRFTTSPAIDARGRTSHAGEEAIASTSNKKSGKGPQDGVVSELATFWEVLPGHEDELRAATERFGDTLRAVDRDKNLRTGLRDQRHVIFDNGMRLMWGNDVRERLGPLLRRLRPDRHRALPGLAGRFQLGQPPGDHLRRQAAQRRHRGHPLHPALSTSSTDRRSATASTTRPSRLPAPSPTCAAPTRSRRTWGAWWPRRLRQPATRAQIGRAASGQPPRRTHCSVEPPGRLTSVPPSQWR